MIIGISGRINSGKTTLSLELGNYLGCKVASFGNLVRNIATSRGISHDRESLQNLGQLLVEKELDFFCQSIFNMVEWNRIESLIIEGIRHVAVLQKIKLIIQSSQLFYIYIETSLSELEKRDKKESSILKRKNFENHSTEIDVLFKLKSKANLVVDSSQDYESMFYNVISAINNNSL